MTQLPEKNRLPEKQSPMAQAVGWVSRITTVALEMVLPGVFGQYLDGHWDTKFLGITGFALGMIVGIWHLLKMTSQELKPKNKQSQRDDIDGKNN